MLDPFCGSGTILIEAALILLILASTIIYGFPYDKTTHRRIGWGFGGGSRRPRA